MAPLIECSGVTENCESRLASQGLDLPADRRIHLGSTYVVSIHAALNGAGLAMAHDTVAADLIASGALVRPYAHSALMAQAYFLIAPPRGTERPPRAAP